MSLITRKGTKYQKGFTIVELLIVVVIIGILAAIVIVAYNGLTNRAKQSSAQTTASTIAKKAETYNAELGVYPPTFAALSGAASSASYFVSATSVHFKATNDITLADSQQSDGAKWFNYATCVDTNGKATGARVQVWDYTTSALATPTYIGGASAADTCTNTAT